MGEAKRRRERAGSAGAYRNAQTGERVDVREGPDPLEFRDRLVAGFAAHGRESTQHVKCDGCRECCWHNAVDVDPATEPPERLQHLQIEWREDLQGWALKKRDDGACVHLGPNGCTVYSHRPTACRGYDCRLYALVGVLDSFDHGHRAPLWRFMPKSRQSRAFYAACVVMGQVEHAKRYRAGDDCSAAAVLEAVMTSEQFHKGWAAIAALLEASPEQQKRILGFDPADISKSQMISALQALWGGDGQLVMVERQKSPE